jgi:CO dehydrogenase nickel-insertion accessory protein CooC1
MVTDTTAKGLRTASSIRGIAGEYGIQGDYTKGVILNRIRGTEIDEMVKKANGLGIEILGFMPEDPCITEHDLLDIPITDIPDDSPCLKAVRDILEKQGFFHDAHRHEAAGTLR